MIPLRVIIADDEPLARSRIRRLLANEQHVQVMAECQSAQELRAVAETAAADLIFLDVDMPEEDGFAVLSALPAPLPSVVFVTAHAEFAVRAFEIDAADYLLKPVSLERLQLALRRVRRQRQEMSGRTAGDPPPGPVGAAAGPYAERIAVTLGRRTHLLHTDSIDCVTAQANYVELLAAQRQFLLRESLNRFEARLDPSRFLRIHRSCIVRIAAISEVEPMPSGRYHVHLHGGLTTQCGRSYRDRLREVLGLVASA